MPESKEEINILELLIKIKEDVATIKADMASFQKAQEQERRHIQEDYSELADRVTELEKTITELKQADNNKDAVKWRRVTAFILTALGGASLTGLFNLIKSFLEHWKNGS